ncbi:Uncharacterised protein [Vibrio cholerae]|nr:Uncharacterised protein [Vibrio cholerae]
MYAKAYECIGLCVNTFKMRSVALLWDTQICVGKRIIALGVILTSVILTYKWRYKRLGRW